MAHTRESPQRGPDDARIIEEHRIAGRHDEGETDASDCGGRRWYDLRPEPRRRSNLMGFNSTWWMAVVWVIVILVVAYSFPWWWSEMSTVRQPSEETKMTPLIDRRLVDKAIEAYVDWREACIWLNDAYLVWSRQRGSNADVTFGGYAAALDREERTAARYARVLNGVSDVVGRADAYLQPRPAGVTEASGR